MTSGFFTVEYASMVKGGQAVETALQRIQGHLNTLDGEVGQLMGGWRGASANAFTGVHGEWKREQQALIAALTRMHAALTATQTTYSNQEQVNSDSFSGIASALNS